MLRPWCCPRCPRVVARHERNVMTVNPLAAAAVGAAVSLAPLAVFNPADSTEAMEAQPVNDRPNILLTLVDDMRPDDIAAMPNVRQLLGAPGGGVYRDHH